MIIPAFTLSALALLLPPFAAPLPVPAEAVWHEADVARAAAEQPRPEFGLGASGPAAALRILEGARRAPSQHQVRIESRVIIRISPAPQAQREQMLSLLPRRTITTTFAEIEHGACVPVEQIAGFQPNGEDRLLLFLRDRRVLSAALERSCNARAFYSGFYVERSEDGNLCVARDRLQSRSGASCQVDTLHQLVAVRD